ncbi:MAG: hypothetical protein RIA69_19800 [Cyclobacteriaceae bacterium]
MIPKNIKIILFFLILLTVAILESCKCYNKGDPQTLENAYTISFILFDKDTNEPLFGFGAKYDFDSVFVYDANGVLIYPGPIPGDGMVVLSPYRRSDAIIPLEKDTTEYYYLHLIEQGLDIDTLRVDYRAGINDCSEKEFTKLNLYYNEELIYDNDRPTTGYYVELYK